MNGAIAIDVVDTETEQDWQVVDRTLRSIAAKRAALDADEARWLREAEMLQIWRPLGMVSALDYMERVFGYAPRTAHERLRVARQLGSLVELEAAMARGELAFSAVRELTRVATPATEGAWIRAAAGKNLRQIEELVADHEPGDGPDDPANPEARARRVTIEFSAATTYALMRQARTILDDERGARLEEDAFYAAMARGVIDGRGGAGEPDGRAAHQIAVTLCQACRRGWQHGGGAAIAIDAAAVERAECNAQRIGSLDGDGPERATQDVPPAVVRWVWRRDGGRCRVDGCRSARCLEIHHIIRRADGGGHDAENLVLVCDSCHAAHHGGRLLITGTASALVCTRPNEVRAHVGTNAIRAHVGTTGVLAETVARTQAKDALAKMGWGKRTARGAVDAVMRELPPDAGFEVIVRAALRRCSA